MLGKTQLARFLNKEHHAFIIKGMDMRDSVESLFQQKMSSTQTRRVCVLDLPRETKVTAQSMGYIVIEWSPGG